MKHPKTKVLSCKRCCKRRKHSLREVRGDVLVYRCDFCHLTATVPRKKEDDA